MNYNMKEVYFEHYCKTCEYFNKKEDEAPCDDCLSIPARFESHKPECWKEKVK